MKKILLAVAVAMAISLTACGPKSPTGDMKKDASYLVEYCVKAQKDGKTEDAKHITEEYMQYYRDKSSADAAEFAFTVLGEISNLSEEDKEALDLKL